MEVISVGSSLPFGAPGHRLGVTAVGQRQVGGPHETVHGKVDAHADLGAHHVEPGERLLGTVPEQPELVERVDQAVWLEHAVAGLASLPEAGDAGTS